jgi:hypothetical protein
MKHIGTGPFSFRLCRFPHLLAPTSLSIECLTEVTGSPSQRCTPFSCCCSTNHLQASDLTPAWERRLHLRLLKYVARVPSHTRARIVSIPCLVHVRKRHLRCESDTPEIAFESGRWINGCTRAQRVHCTGRLGLLHGFAAARRGPASHAVSSSGA